MRGRHDGLRGCSGLLCPIFYGVGGSADCVQNDCRSQKTPDRQSRQTSHQRLQPITTATGRKPPLSANSRPMTKTAQPAPRPCRVGCACAASAQGYQFYGRWGAAAVWRAPTFSPGRHLAQRQSTGVPGLTLHTDRASSGERSSAPGGLPYPSRGTAWRASWRCRTRNAPPPLPAPKFCS